MLALLDRDHLDEVLARRHAWGADRFDEVWEGVPHFGRVVGPRSELQQQLALLLRPAASAAGLVAVLGAYDPPEPGSPPRAIAVRVRGDGAGTAALAVEIVDAGDRDGRMSAIAADRVGELMLVDPRERTVRWLVLADGAYRSVDASGVIHLDPAELAGAIDWPPHGHA